MDRYTWRSNPLNVSLRPSHTQLGTANWWGPTPLRHRYARFGLREAPAAESPSSPAPRQNGHELRSTTETAARP
jgi:hypothetical protein